MTLDHLSHLMGVHLLLDPHVSIAGWLCEILLALTHMGNAGLGG